MTTLAGIKAGLAVGGRHRLDALDKLRLMVRTDAGRQVGEMTANGWDPHKAVESYRQWLRDWADGVVDEFEARDQQ